MVCGTDVVYEMNVPQLAGGLVACCLAREFGIGQRLEQGVTGFRAAVPPRSAKGLVEVPCHDEWYLGILHSGTHPAIPLMPQLFHKPGPHWSLPWSRLVHIRKDNPMHDQFSQR
jgi:hypothetical protein